MQKEHKTCHAIIVGGDGVSYGRKPLEAPNWREHMLREVTIDPARTHFMGRLPYEQYVRVLQVSATHVYLTYPFVLSWSLLEAMACGCLVVASDTAPVREVVADGENGMLLGALDSASTATGIVEALSTSDHAGSIRRAARACVIRSFPRGHGLGALDSLVYANREMAVPI